MTTDPVAPAPVPIPVARPLIEEQDIEAVTRVLRSGWLSTGEECERLEADLARVTGAAHAIGVSSCTAALELAFRSLRLSPGARVGVPTWTFVASALAPRSTGAVPVLLDVDPRTLNLSPDAVEAALPSLDALVVVHFGGAPVDRRIFDLAAAAGVPVVEDAAHALGTIDHRGPMAGRGTVGACFSFYATKNITSGEGGALVTDDAEVAAFCRSQRLHGVSADAWARYRPGAKRGYDLVEPGLKANLPDVLAALARSQLARLDDVQARRRELVGSYHELLSSVAGLELVPGEVDQRSADHLMVVLLPSGRDRDEVAARLADHGIGTSVHFQPLHRFSWFATHAEVGPSGLDGADAVADRALSLPLHSGLELEDVERVSTALRDALGS